METKQIESGVQLFSRINQKYLLNGINPHIFPEDGPNPNQIIELVSENDVETSNLIIDFIVRSILPKKYNPCWKECGVILINTTFQIREMNIIKVMSTHLKNMKVPHTKQVIENSLKNLTIFHCYDGDQTKLTFYNLERTLHQKDNVALLVVDSISAHYWAEKFTNQRLSLNQYSKKIFEILYKVVKNMNLTLMFSRNERDIVKRALTLNIDYKIIIQKLGTSSYKAVILDIIKNTERNVAFRVSKMIEFSSLVESTNPE